MRSEAEIEHVIAHMRDIQAAATRTGETTTLNLAVLAEQALAWALGRADSSFAQLLESLDAVDRMRQMAVPRPPPFLQVSAKGACDASS